MQRKCISLAYLLAIARNTCADATRSRVRARAHLRALDPATEDASAVDGPWAEVEDLLRGLDLDRREAFVLTQLLDLPYAEAAEVAGCPVGTIRSRVSRARADLLDALEEAPGRHASG